MNAFQTDLTDHQVLIIEDSMEYKHLISQALGRSSKHVYVSSLKESTNLLNTHDYDCILLDLSLPDGSGFDILKILQNNHKSTPVIILSSSKELANKVMGLSMGAQDYLEKPFEAMELVARMKNKILFSKKNETKSKHIELGNLTIDFSRRKVSLQSKDNWIDLDLTRKEFELLLAFANHPEIVLSRENLLDRVWGSENFVLERSVDSTLASLRKKLKYWDFKIRSVYGVGYQLVRKPKKRTTSHFDPTLIKIFKNESHIQLSQLEAAINDQDWNLSAKLAHKLKGTFSIFSTKTIPLADKIDAKFQSQQNIQEDLTQFLKVLKSDRINILSKVEDQAA